MVEISENEFSTRTPVRNVIETAYTELEKLTDEINKNSEIEAVDTGRNEESQKAKTSEYKSPCMDDTT